MRNNKAAEILYIDFHIDFCDENIGKPSIYKIQKGGHVKKHDRLSFFYLKLIPAAKQSHPPDFHRLHIDRNPRRKQQFQDPPL